MTAAVLAIAAILVLVEVVAALLRRPAVVLPVPGLARLGRDAHWDDLFVLAVAAAVAALGLALLYLALSPGRPRAVALESDEPDVLMAIAPPGLRRHAKNAAEGVDGITYARVKTRRRRMRVRAHSPLLNAHGLTDEVRHAVQERLDALAVSRPPRLRVTVRHREE